MYDDTGVPINKQEQEMCHSEMIKVQDRNSFRDFQKNKMNQVLSIDNTRKLTDAELANYEEYFFE